MKPEPFATLSSIRDTPTSEGLRGLPPSPWPALASALLCLASCSSGEGLPTITSTVPEPAAPSSGTASGPLATASLLADGHYSVVFANLGWTFAGSLGVSPTRVAPVTGSDGGGAYHELTFAFDDGTAKTAGIRLYDASPVALFTVTHTQATANGARFPSFSSFPALAHHVTYADQEFSPVTFTDFTPDSPFVFFDDAANAFILSAGSHFMNAASDLSADGVLSTGIDPAITALPAGFTESAVLVAEPGIRAAYGTWGGALLALSGKTRAPNDATPELERFGYWTDNGASYYYKTAPSSTYPATLLAIRDDYANLGIPLAYMQLDSWWYPKGPAQDWAATSYGLYQYVADPALFPMGLTAFQQSLGLPLITHARWIDPSSPYRSQYAMSNNVSIDPAYWASIAGYLGAADVHVYEQDWLNVAALPKTDNLHDQDAFLDDMAAAMSQAGLTMQYCMPLPRHFLQSTKYQNLLTTRVSDDRFESARYHDFFYTSLLAGSLGEWPWSDVFYSAERDNLLVSTLSAGMVGVGDAIGTESTANIFQAIRPDGVIVKPDVPTVPLDSTFVREAQGVDAPLLAAATTDFGGLRATYVYAFQAGANATATFTPSELGYAGAVYVLDGFLGQGQWVAPGGTYSTALSGGSGYYVVAPVGPSGIALLGDAGKFVALGKKRVPALTDDGAVHASVAFASGEGSVTLRGYASAPPTAQAMVGTASAVTYDAVTGLFTVVVTGDHGVATLSLQ